MGLARLRTWVIPTGFARHIFAKVFELTFNAYMYIINHVILVTSTVFFVRVALSCIDDV